ncbi:MAG: right-handed parallel beta-helix repeat-containing protein [Sedimentisphaerales bacterium]|nr:right-handed parallel beta-helix repeat-containing protein [Sedimentisphaerales bacterium]
MFRTTKRTINLTASLILLVTLRTTSAVKAEELNQDTTWSGTYVIENTIVVPAGIVLNIEPGTEVLMKEEATLVINGQLLADGTEDQPIRFTRFQEGTTWKNIMFVNVADSRLANCIIEYADSEGAHQDYYEPGPRDYHEAVVVLASHVDIEKCTFRNLPDESANADGDAIAIISDDPNHPGNATANIKSCQFLSIGQGVHTRYSYVLVEDCYFTGKRGDNDDLDLYGESLPAPLIRNNVFLNPEHDDMINPTKCSAVIVGNIIGGCDDHGIVLRDKCYPVLMNNVIYDCRNAGVAIENSCEALLMNNTIFDCGRGLRLFDLGRAGPPYYLTPGGGTATVINCIIWNCPQPATLTDSSNTDAEDRGSHITFEYCNIEGGQDSISISGDHSTLTWGMGNIDTDPLFVNPDIFDFHLKSEAGRWDPNSESWVIDDGTSPCIDAGDPNSDWTSETWPHGQRINMGAYGNTQKASMSMESQTIFLPNIAYIYNSNAQAAQNFQTLLVTYGCSTDLISIDEISTTSLDSYDIIITADDTGDSSEWWGDTESVTAIENSGRPVIGLGEGGYAFFGQLELAIGWPHGVHGSHNSIYVVEPNSPLFVTPYPVEIPEDSILQLYSESNYVPLFLSPVPDTVTTLGRDADSPGYYPLATEHNRYIFWGFSASPENMTDIGKHLFINLVIWSANESQDIDEQLP